MGRSKCSCHHHFLVLVIVLLDVLWMSHASAADEHAKVIIFFPPDSLSLD